jgi:putative membrane protein
MKTKLLYIFFIIAVPIFLISCNSQSGRDGNNDNDSIEMNENAVDNDALGMGDNDVNTDFVMEAASGGLMEVELGRYAQQNAVNPRVKNFGAMMVRDHSKANDELKSLATKLNITIPATMNDKHMDMVNDLKEKTGTEFDREYMDEMVSDHENDVDKFKKYAEKQDANSELKAFAANTLTVLLMHQDSAKRINDFLKENK